MSARLAIRRLLYGNDHILFNVTFLYCTLTAEYMSFMEPRKRFPKVLDWRLNGLSKCIYCNPLIFYVILDWIRTCDLEFEVLIPKKLNC